MPRSANPRYARYRSLGRRYGRRISAWLSAIVTTLTGTGATTAFTGANATNILTSAAHGFVTGDGPLVLSNAGGALPDGLSDTARYFVRAIDANTFTLHTSREGAIADLGTAEFVDDGTGTHSFAWAAESADDIRLLIKRGVPVAAIKAASDVDAIA